METVLNLQKSCTLVYSSISCLCINGTHILDVNRRWVVLMSSGERDGHNAHQRASARALCFFDPDWMAMRRALHELMFQYGGA